MKKLFTLFTLLIISIMVYPQDTSKHLLFSGIPVAGSANSFRQSMEKKGFVFNSDESSDEYLVFNGDFIGKSTDDIIVSLTPITKQVWRVMVFFNESDNISWYSLKSEFNKLKDQLIVKYGQPLSDYNFFISPYEEGDGYEMTAVNVDKCRYFTSWEYGIAIRITKFSNIQLIYEDQIQVKLEETENNEVVQNGL